MQEGAAGVALAGVLAAHVQHAGAQHAGGDVGEHAEAGLRLQVGVPLRAQLLVDLVDVHVLQLRGEGPVVGLEPNRIYLFIYSGDIQSYTMMNLNITNK